MAGIHLPDIGKLGIHIATGIRDRKKVGPSNMAEEAKLKTLSNKLDSEKHERCRYLKKEERRMKRKKQTIDKRRGDIGLNHAGKTKPGNLPPIKPRSQISGKRENPVKENCADKILDTNTTATALFPIQDELGLVADFNKKQLLVSPRSFSPPAVCSRGRLVLPSLEADGTMRRNSKKRKTKKAHKAKRLDDIKDWPDADDAQELCRRESIFRDGQESRPDDDIEMLSCDVEGALVNQNNDRKNSPEFQDGKRSIQKTLEEVYLAIQACRYIRTPSKQTATQTDL